ncbi:MAG: ABC transporter substrate-binding protein [Candidatus Hydrogenedentes bacterium]|nr:ABC transporter substrate-binding protein [Candidatus Hydrogenedentota bacterium]
MGRTITKLVGTLALLFAFAGILPACIQRVADGKTAIAYWRTLSGAAGDTQDKIVAQFNASQSDVVVKSEYQGTYSDLATKLIAATAAKSGPDVTQLGTFEIRQFAKSGVLVDLTPYLNGPNGIDRSEWPESMARAGEIDGGTYWLPFNVAVPTLYYNKKAFADAGIAEAPATWSEFFSVVRKLTKEDRPGLALWSNTWPLFSMIWSEGGELTTRDYANITLNDPVVVYLLKELQNLVREGAVVVPDKASGGHRAAFVNGRAAIILDSQDAFSEVFAQSNGFTPGVANYPAGAKGKVYAPGGGGIAMMSITSAEKRDAAWAFMRYMLSPEQIADYSSQSGYAAFSKSAQLKMGKKLSDPRFKVIHDALPYVRADFSVNMSPALRSAFDEAFQKILMQAADVQQALDTADAKAEAAVKSELAR